ncbi:hypothetical protein BSF41_17520 [Flavobacterium sp. ACN2]|nr:hypothetical protein BSF41_17520 [Flavobacterium sp. ACN2]
MKKKCLCLWIKSNIEKQYTYLDTGLTTEPIQSPILKKFYLLDEENKIK